MQIVISFITFKQTSLYLSKSIWLAWFLQPSYVKNLYINICKWINIFSSLYTLYVIIFRAHFQIYFQNVWDISVGQSTCFRLCNKLQRNPNSKIKQGKKWPWLNPLPNFYHENQREKAVRFHLNTNVSVTHYDTYFTWELGRILQGLHCFNWSL